MRYEILKKEVRVSESLEEKIDRKVAKIDARLKRYHPDVAHMEIRLGHLEKMNEFECALQLTAFKDSLHTKKSAPELRVAVDRSFEALLRELEHYRLKINKSLQAST